MIWFKEYMLFSVNDGTPTETTICVGCAKGRCSNATVDGKRIIPSAAEYPALYNRLDCMVVGACDTCTEADHLVIKKEPRFFGD